MLNPNSKVYLNHLYSNPSWKDGYQDAYKRLDLVIKELKEYEFHLDIGCADGYFTKTYLKKYPNTIGYGIDLSDVIIKNSPNLLQGDIYDLPFPDKSFDLIHCGELLEHLEEPQKAINEMRRVLNKNGTLIITTPNEKADNYKEHLWRWNIKEVVELLKGFKVVKKKVKFFNDHIMYIRAKKL